MISPPGLQFGRADPEVVHLERPTAFGLVVRAGTLACVRVTRDTPYHDLPGGAVEAGESEAEALVREFLEETGLTVRPVERIAEAGQYFRRSDGSPVNNLGGFWIAEVLSSDRAAKVEDDHELLWLTPDRALTELRHDAHAWAVAVWLRHHA